MTATWDGEIFKFNPLKSIHIRPVQRDRQHMKN